MYSGSLTLRKAFVLATKLPPGARLWIELGHPDSWSDESYLLANVVDLLNGANWQRSGGKGRAPKPIERPEDIHKARQRELKNIAKAERFRARQAAKASTSSKNQEKRPRDERGRFVRKEG